MAQDYLLQAAIGALEGFDKSYGKYQDLRVTDELARRRTNDARAGDLELFKAKLPLQRQADLQGLKDKADMEFSEYERKLPLEEASKIRVANATPKQFFDEDGNLIATGGKGAQIIRPKPQTEAQGQSAIYGQRAQDAEKIIGKLEGYASSANPASFGAQMTLPASGFLGAVSNVAKSDDFQSIEQAQRNFLNAVLRRESGAVISPSEFSEGRAQYFPMPGDSEEVLAQKRRNRQVQIRGLISSAGKAYNKLGLGNDGGLPEPAVTAPASTGKTKSGLSYTVEQ